MLASTIAQILLRIFSISWFVTGIVHLVPTVFDVRSGRNGAVLYSAVPLLIMCAFGVVIWVFARKISLVLTKGNDAELNLTNVSAQQLMTIAIFSVGLYFVLSSCSDTFNWVHYLFINRSLEHRFAYMESPSYYDLARPLLTLLAGLAFMLTSKNWATKIFRETKNEA